MCAGDFVEVYSHPSQAGESLLGFLTPSYFVRFVLW